MSLKLFKRRETENKRQITEECIDNSVFIVKLL